MKIDNTDADIIFAYTRKDALQDGELVDVTEWASAEKGFFGGFLCPVALTRSLWASIQAIPDHLEGIQDIRGRAHDVLWMASLGLRKAFAENEKATGFEVLLAIKGNTRKKQSLFVVFHPGDQGEPVVTIGFPEDF